MRNSIFLASFAIAGCIATSPPAPAPEPKTKNTVPARMSPPQPRAPILTTSAWATALIAAIERNWVRLKGEEKNGGCKLRLNLLPNGEVTNVAIVESCGSKSLDDSIIKAVLKSSPLPMPDEPSIFRELLVVNFVPGKPNG